MNTIYALVVIFGYPIGAAIQLELPSLEACKAAKAQVERMTTHRDSACIEKNFKVSK
jgi:hypothetical protein